MRKLVLLLASMAIFVACSQVTIQEQNADIPEDTKPEAGTTVVKQVAIQDDFTGAKIDPAELLQGCFGQDCIPSIDAPIFESAEVSDQWLEDDDIVFAITYKDVQRAYPQRILNWHEIVNDTIAGDAIGIAFCPLCGSANAFSREVDGIITEFGVSGKLHNSDLVMYDRYEGNLWQQITREAIVGPAARRDEVLTDIAIATTTWAEWQERFPDTEVLSRNTGFTRNYNQYPYGAYERNDEIFFGVENLDQSLQIKTPVYGIEIGDSSKAYPDEIFETTPVIEDQVGGVNIKLEKDPSGEIIITNTDTNERIVPIRLFWFAWAAFHPDTELYQP